MIFEAIEQIVRQIETEIDSAESQASKWKQLLCNVRKFEQTIEEEAATANSSRPVTAPLTHQPTPLHRRVELALRSLENPASPSEIQSRLEQLGMKRTTGLERQKVRTRIATALQRKPSMFRKQRGCSKWELI